MRGLQRGLPQYHRKREGVPSRVANGCIVVANGRGAQAWRRCDCGLTPNARAAQFRLPSMKTTHTYKASWFVFATVAFIITGELVTLALSQRFGFTNSPITVALLCAGLAAVLVDTWFDGPHRR
jgi:hypothetical protein